MSVQVPLIDDEWDVNIRGIRTPPGTKCPSMISTPSGLVRRGRRTGTGGYMRSDSSITASRYLSPRVDFNVISVSDPNADSTSSRTRLILSGLESSKNVAAQSAPAVVSDPARIKAVPAAVISAVVIPLDLLC